MTTESEESHRVGLSLPAPTSRVSRTRKVRRAVFGTARSAIVLSLPVLLVFLLLAAFDLITPEVAALAYLASLLGMAGLLRQHVGAIHWTIGALRRLAEAQPLGRPSELETGDGRQPLTGTLLDVTLDLGRTLETRTATANDLSTASAQIIDRLPDPLMILSPDRKILRANEPARQLFGPNVSGLLLPAVIRHPDLLEGVDMVLDDGLGRTIEISVPVPLNRTYVARVEPVSRIDEGRHALLILFHDVTALKRSEQMRADFVANASHELRTPLTSLIGFIETMLGPAREDPEAQVRFLTLMHEQASRMTRLVQDLMSLSRIEMLEHTQPSEQVDIRDAVGSVVDSLELSAEAKGMSIEVTRADWLPSAIGDPDQLAQVFQNLLENAIKYSRKGGTVKVGIEAVDPADSPDRLLSAPGVYFSAPSGYGGRRLLERSVIISVRDHGDGIAREHLPRLTERFYRVDSDRSRSMGGTGLGLAIVKHIVSRHRGILEIDSVVGAGSTFRVHLPASDETAGPPAPLPAPEPAAALGEGPHQA